MVPHMSDWSLVQIEVAEKEYKLADNSVVQRE